MKSTLPMFLLSLIATVDMAAQQPYYNQQSEFLNANKTWAFAHNAGLDFNSGTAVVIQTAIPSTPNRQGEGTSAVSDPQTGALLFYTDGAQCWNANGQVMPNGDSLLGNSGKKWTGGNGTYMTTTQGSCIVPVPGEVGKYYLFSMNYQGEIDPAGSLFYNVVDMSLENGLGNIVSGQKNILLDSTSLSEAMIAIPGNNCDAWLVVHASPLDTANNVLKSYKAYHITESGVDPNPVISYGKTHSFAGGMSVSPGRDRIALVGLLPETINPLNGVRMGGVEVVKFDPNTGMISDPIEIFSDGIGSHGCAFSPDNSKLYIDHTAPSTGTNLLQYDITTFDSLSIDTSKKIISPVSTAFGAGLRLYNDTIYVAGFGTASLGRINQPNLSGAACDYQNGAINLLSGTSSAMACLPTEVVIPGSPDTSHTLVLDTLLCSGWSPGFSLHPSEVYTDYTYEWQDQSSDTMLTITQAGTYWVRYSNGCHTFVDSFIVDGEELIPPVINVDVFELSTTVPYASYQWMYNGTIIPGEDNATLTVSENGDYQVIVTNEAGCVDTSDIYTVTNANSIQHIHPLASKVTVYPNPANAVVYIQAPVPVALQLRSIEGRLLQSLEQEKQLSLTAVPAGIYLLQVIDMEGVLIKTVKLVKNP